MTSLTAALSLARLRKALLMVIACLFALLLVLAAMLSWLVFSESGARQLFSTLARYELLTYQSLRGSISGGLQIETLNIKTASADIDITALSLSADWSELFYSKLQINELSAHSVTIELIQSGAQTPQDKPFNLSFLEGRPVFIPLQVDLQQLSVQQLTINNAGQSHKLRDIELSSRIDQEGISATQLSLNYEESTLQLQGRVAVAPKLAIDLALNWNSLLPDNSTVAGKAALKGDARQLNFSHQTSGSLVSDINITASNWLKQPQLSLQGTVAKLSWPLTSKVPRLSELVLSAEGNLSALQANIQGQLQLSEQDKTAFEMYADISPTRLNISKLQLTDNNGGIAPKLAIDLSLNWNSLLPDNSTVVGKAVLKGDARQLNISHQTSGSLVSDINITASNWLKQPQLSLQGTVAKLSWPLSSKVPQLSGLVLSAEGNLSALQTHIQGQLQLNEQGKTAFEMFADISPTRLHISKLQLMDKNGGSAQISAHLSWLDGVPRWQGQLNLNKFNGQKIHQLLPQQLVGKLNIDGSFNTGLQLNIASSKLQGVLQKRSFDAQINAQVQGDNIRIKQLQASVGDNRLALSGRIEKSIFDITFNSQITDLKAILPGSQGAIQASGSLTGTRQRPTLKAQLQGQQLNLYDFSATEITLAIDLLDGVFQKARNQLDAQNLRYQSIYLEQLKMTAEGSWLEPALWFETASSLLQVNAQSDLQFNKPGRIAGRLKQLQLKGDTIGDWQLEQPVSYQVAAQDWSLAELCLKENGGRACIEASGEASTLTATLSARQLPVALLNATALLNTPISGQLDIEASVTGDSQQHQGQLRLTQSRADTPLLLTADDAANTQISIAGLVSVIELTNGTLSGTFNARLNDTGSLSSEFEIAQLLAEHSPLEARIDYKIPDLQPYALLIPEVDALSGELEGNIRLDNSLQKPRLSLYTRLKVPHIYISPLAIEWTDLSAEITTLSGSRQQINASLKAGDGQLNLTGTLTFTSIDNWLSELHIKGDNVLLMDQPNRRVLASPDMQVSATADSIKVTGLLRIPEAKLNIKPTPNRLTLTPDAVIHSSEGDAANDVAPYRFNLKLAVLLGDKVNFEAYGLKTDVTGKLLLTQQSPDSLLGNGELNLINGAYQAYGQDLTIERGVIRFTGLLSRPEIDLTASRTVKSVKAGLQVNGPVDDLRTRLYSEPAMPDSEILSYIIRGKPLRSANASDQNALADALLAYSISQSTPVTSKLTALSGLDEIGLEAEEGVETLGFTLGKYITPRLYARYGIGVIDKLSKVFLQYQLSDKLYLETESGQGQSVDLMYRSR